jgi:hypothetical protein
MISPVRIKSDIPNFPLLSGLEGAPGGSLFAAGRNLPGSIQVRATFAPDNPVPLLPGHASRILTLVILLSGSASLFVVGWSKKMAARGSR